MLLSLVANAITSLVANATSQFDNIDQVLQEHAQRYDIPALSVVIRQGDKIIYDQTHGQAALSGPDNPIDSHTPMFIGSVSKPITASALMLLVAQGKIDLNAPVTDYLRELKFKHGGEGKVKVKHLLNHTSGLSSLNYKYQANQRFETSDIIKDLAQVKLATIPGEHFSYSNTGYHLLGEIIERVSGQPFDRFVHEALFTPLGMSQSATIASKHVTHSGYSAFMGFNLKRQELTHNLSEIPAGFILSSAQDLSRFMQFQLTGLDKEGKPLLSQSQLAMLRPPLNSQADNGLSWFNYSNGDMSAFGHDGVLANHMAEVIAMPEQELSIVLLANKSGLPLVYFAHPQLIAALKAELQGKPHAGNGLVTWLILLYPLLILADVISHIFSTRKYYLKYLVQGNVSQQSTRRDLVGIVILLVFILALPYLVQLLLGRGMTYYMLWYMAPDLVVWLGIIGLLTLIKLGILIKGQANRAQSVTKGKTQIA
ncbi:serine hydrolase domain-containing protein [Motilimonas eburnea]|uniref:serine hydrolase domain-containing protein n=1 Tax=Motilimonas eburnea TaxID=1737488 RepID=UPI001E319A6F|nr:serine hydrolase domain-containing protein [Motilimonas eburnea]MCE2570872.1 beta-lactamase family protein [Motilimonas eburnea]